jgi:hypothetical protein
LLETTRTKRCLELGAMAFSGVYPLRDAVLGGKVAVVGFWGVVVFSHFGMGLENKVFRDVRGGIYATNDRGWMREEAGKLTR